MSSLPNIVVVTCHDTGCHFGCYGADTVHTPAIDAFAADGVRFDGMFAVSPMSSPSRGSLLTGLYPQENGLVGLAGGRWGWELRSPALHLASMLSKAGYDTTLFGVHHETGGDPMVTLGFEHRVVGGSAIDTASAFDEFCRTRHQGSSPFYAQVGFFETHTPYDFGDTPSDDERGVDIPLYVAPHVECGPTHLRFFADDPAKTHAHMAGFQGSVRRADAGFGLIMESLRATGLDTDTLVLFTVDHGPELPGAKWTLFDPGLHVAFILRWPGGNVVGGRVCDWMLSNVDFLPTLHALTGIPLASHFSGYSFAAGCDRDGASLSSPRDAAYGVYIMGDAYAVRTDQFKLIRGFGECPPDPDSGNLCPLAQLFDLHADPLETRNVIDDPAYAAAAELMNGLLWQWLEDVDDPILNGPVPTPTYHQAIAPYRHWKRHTTS